MGRPFSFRSRFDWTPPRDTVCACAIVCLRRLSSGFVTGELSRVISASETLGNAKHQYKWTETQANNLNLPPAFQIHSLGIVEFTV